MRQIGKVFSDPYAGVVTVEKIISGGYVCRDEFDEIIFVEKEEEETVNAKIVNMTPHAVDIYGDEGWIMKVNATGLLARVAEQRESCPPVQIGSDISGLYIPTSRATYGAVQGLPEPDGETVYIVSGLVLAQCAGRADVFAPGPAIRDDQGRQVGYHGLSAAPATTVADPLAKLVAWVANRTDWRLVITGTDAGVEVATRYPDGSDHCLGFGSTVAHAAAACMAELEPEARRAVPVIDGIIDDVHAALVGAWVAGGNGYPVEPTRDDAARLLRGLSAAPAGTVADAIRRTVANAVVIPERPDALDAAVARHVARLEIEGDDIWMSDDA